MGSIWFPERKTHMKKYIIFCAGLAVGLGIPPYVRGFHWLIENDKASTLAVFYVGPAAILALMLAAAGLILIAQALLAIGREIRARLTWKE